MKPHFLSAVFLFISVAAFSQHMTEIKNALYPGFHEEQWMREERLTENYEPIDFSLSDESPKSFDFEEAFKGYYTLEGFLGKRNRELMGQLDEKEKAALSASNRRWMQKRDEQCNALWKTQNVGYSQVVMEYMYCMNAMTKTRLDSLGGGILLNQKVDQFSGAKPYLIDSDLDQFSDLVPDGQSHGLTFFKPKVEATLLGRKADVRLGFLNGKLTDISIGFGKCSCQSKIMNETVRELGSHTVSTFDPITLYSSYTWKGLKSNLRLIDDDSSVTVEIWKR